MSNEELEAAAYAAIAQASLKEPSDIEASSTHLKIIAVNQDANIINQYALALHRAGVNFMDPRSSIFDGDIKLTSLGRETPRYEIKFPRLDQAGYHILLKEVPVASVYIPQQPDQSTAGSVLTLDKEAPKK